MPITVAVSSYTLSFLSHSFSRYETHPSVQKLVCKLHFLSISPSLLWTHRNNSEPLRQDMSP